MNDVDALLDAMQAHGECKADLARLLGVSRSFVSQVFSGKRDFTVEQAEKIARHYGLTPDHALKIFFFSLDKSVSS
ncbi:MAG: helix-turn-helix domain-containing protein [Clostridia bacterium]|nr:helix-turn-helix domain-containing protein [Clostridia bacterium]